MSWKKVHPVAQMFPLLPQSELDVLAADIKEHGQIEPVVVDSGTLLDGRNRVAACELAGVDVEWIDYDGDDPQAFIISSNLHRRHLNTSQRSLIASRMATKTVGKPAANSVDLQNNGVSEVASLLNVSPAAVQIARRVEKHGAAAVVQAVDDGRMKLHEADGLLDMPKSDQAEVARIDDPSERRRIAAEKKRDPIIVKSTHGEIATKDWNHAVDLLNRALANLPMSTWRRLPKDTRETVSQRLTAHVRSLQQSLKDELTT